MKALLRLLMVFAACVSAASSSVGADPPGRVGRISLLSGTVYLYNDSYGENQSAKLNWPITTGDTLSTAPGSRAEVRIGSTAVRLDGDSELEFAVLDDQRLRLRLVGGAIAVRVRDPEQARQFVLTTPQGSVALHDVGAYRFEAGRRPDTTVVTAFDGAAAFTGDGLALSVRSGQRAEIFGDRNLSYAITPAVQDDFDAWSLARDRRDDEARSVRYVSREMTGYEDLDAYGDWRETAEYGAVWYPRYVSVGWAPYRTGHWAWVEPWGWTWIDDAPWGFAPFHYGRWVFVGGIWGWVPGPIIVRPIYAPALVVWIGDPGWHLSFAVGAGPAVGWFPLGPREVFVPYFRCSTVFVQRINAPHVTNVTQILNVQREPHRVNHVNRSHPGAVTIVPRQVVSDGAPVSRHALRSAQAQSIGTLPAAVAAPSITPPQRRDRAAPARAPSRASREQAAPPARVDRSLGGSSTVAPVTREPRNFAPPRPAAAPATDAEEAGRRSTRRRDVEPSSPLSRPAEPAAVVPREPRAAVPPRPAAPAAVPDDARRGASRREAEREVPQSRRMESAPPVAAPPARFERDAQRPTVVPRQAVAPPQVVAPRQVVAPPQVVVPQRAVAPPPQRAAPPPPRAAEMPRGESRGAAVGAPRDGGRGQGGPAGREPDGGIRPGPGGRN